MPDFGPWLPTVTAVVAAVVAGAFAWRANQATIASHRLIEVEKRLATSRLETYRPLIDALGNLFLPDEHKTPQEKHRQQAALETAMKNFLTWVQMYGSDETLRAYHRIAQASYHDAPPNVALRLYGQFLLAARPDLGDSSTDVDTVDLLGIRLNDIYDKGLADELRLPDEAFYRKIGWRPPWGRA